MNNRIQAAIAVAGLLALAACSTAPEIPFDRSVDSQVKTIGVLDPAFPKDSSVILASTVGQSFGIVGNLVDMAMQANREDKFAGLLTQEHFSPKDEFNARVVSSLQSHGYTVTIIPVTRKSTDDYAQTYSADQRRGVDAVLDLVVPTEGYLAAGIGSSTPFRPVVVIKAKLVRSSDSSVLMQDIIFYNPLNEPKGVITLAPDPKYAFVDFDTLMADPTDAVGGLRLAIDQSVDTMTNLLK